MKNQVIKVLNKEHGKKVIQFWKDRGVNTGCFSGSVNEEKGFEAIYYGVINGNFGNYSLTEVQRANAKIIELPNEEIKEESIFKVGDKVYHYSFCWGIIKSIEGSKMIQVEFEKDTITFIDGLWLSFTEYTLQGFSQERPIELPKVGELCLVRDGDNDFWRVREFEFMNDGFWVKARCGSSDCFKQMKRIKILD